MKRFLEPVQVNVRQQWRNHAALRPPLCGPGPRRTTRGVPFLDGRAQPHPHDARLHLRSFRRRCCWRNALRLIFRSGTLVQADLLALTHSMNSVGFLRSTVISRFVATMNPSDSHTSRLTVMLSRVSFAAPRPRSRRPVWVSQVSGCSVGARCPQSPRRVRPLHSLAASRTMSGFVTFGRLATLDWCNEAESGSLALRLTPSLHDRLQRPSYPSRRCRDYMSNEQFTCSVPLN